MSNQSNDENHRVYLAMEQAFRDVLIQYIQAAPSPAGVSVATSNSLCETLLNLHVVNILPQKFTSSQEKKIPPTV